MRMRKHTFERLLRQFPCLVYLGLGKEELRLACIKVGRVDDVLLVKAAYEESGDGIFTNLRSEKRWFVGFADLNPKVENFEVDGMTELKTDGYPFESDKNVADMLKVSKPPVVIIEVFEKINEFHDPENKIVVYRV